MLLAPSKCVTVALMAPSSDSPVVLQVLPSLITGGVERGTVEIAQALVEAEATALVASAGGPLVFQIERAGGVHLTLPLTTKSPIGLWRNAAALEQVIRERGVSLVHARSRAPAWSAWLACQRTGVPFVTTYHGTYGERFPFKRFYNGVMARGQIVIAASQFIADLVVDRHGVDPARIRVIPRGVDPAVFDPGIVSGSRVAKLAAAWRLPDCARVVMLPGRLTSWKGHSVLLDALGHAEQAGRYVCVRRIGPGAPRIRARTGTPSRTAGDRRAASAGRASATICRQRFAFRTWWCMPR